MVVYSHSRLSVFEQCNLKYKYKYIDRIIPEIEKTIEMHLGKVVHSTLEWLYASVMSGIIPDLDEMVVYYSEKWLEEFDESTIKIPRNGMSSKDYFDKGVGFLIDYYTKNKPFDDNTIAVEKEITIELDEYGEYQIRGFIDRLAYNILTGEYEIHDYKTANSLPPKEKIDNDRQLALYSIAIKDQYGIDKKVCLVWHYLAHNMKITSCRSDEDLDNLRDETIGLIKTIESTKDFPPNISRLCDWCEYKSMCEAFGKSPNMKDEFKEDQDKLDIWG
jgi:putative RecB family exonuclease